MASVSVSPVPEGDRDSSGEFVLKKLFAEFVVVGERKIQHACSQPLEYSLAKGLLRGEDAQFDQILSALNEVASFCLRSVLTAIFKWRDMQVGLHMHHAICQSALFFLYSVIVGAVQE
jgi:hypothetical protein